MNKTYISFEYLTEPDSDGPYLTGEAHLTRYDQGTDTLRHSWVSLALARRYEAKVQDRSRLILHNTYTRHYVIL